MRQGYAVFLQAKEDGKFVLLLLLLLLLSNFYRSLLQSIPASRCGKEM